MILLMIYSWEESTYTVRLSPVSSSNLALSPILFQFGSCLCSLGDVLCPGRYARFLILSMKVMPQIHFYFYLSVRVFVSHTCVWREKKNAQICYIVSGPKLVRIKRRVTVGTGLSSCRSVMGVFKSNPLHFSGKMGKQSGISPITPSSLRQE